MTDVKKQKTFSYEAHFRELKNKLDFKSLCGKPQIINSWAAVHLVFAHDQNNLEDGLRLAMIRRTEKKDDPWSGHYAFPGGRAEPNEGLYEAGVRETFEEVGLTLGQEHYLGEFLHMQLRHKGSDLPYGISAHASYLETPSELIGCPNEVDECFWFSLTDLHHKNHLVEKEFHLSGQSRLLPCLSFEEHTVWGLSYLILREVFQQLDGLRFHQNHYFDGQFLPNYPYGKKL